MTINFLALWYGSTLENIYHITCRQVLVKTCTSSRRYMCNQETESSTFSLFGKATRLSRDDRAVKSANSQKMQWVQACSKGTTELCQEVENNCRSMPAKGQIGVKWAQKAAESLQRELKSLKVQNSDLAQLNACKDSYRHRFPFV